MAGIPDPTLSAPHGADDEPLRFEGWSLCPHTRELRVQGVPVRLGNRAFLLLWTLAQREGGVVGKAELFERAWPGRVVEDNNLTVQITALRKVLGHEAIVNVAGVGYRLASRRLQPEGAAAPAAGPPAPSTRAAPRLFGRDEVHARLQQQLRELPLVTLVGPGGVGKTALARWVLASFSPKPPDGVHWIDLAELRPGSELGPVLHEALGVHLAPGTARADLARALGARRALVVLDNCEHVLAEVAALVNPLLEAAPGLHWLCTSQESLRLNGELTVRLPPLAVPATDAGVLPREDAPALQLLKRRVEQTGRAVTWQEAELALAAELCRRLDGLPLAIEIAAAHIDTLGLAGVLEQTDDRMRLRLGQRGAPERHHSLLSTYEWSYGLLNATQQRVFLSLGPCADGFDIQLVRRLHDQASPFGEALANWELLEAVQALADKSLVQRDPERPGRLYLLDSARQFVRVRLAEGGLAEAAFAAHARAVAALYATAIEDLERLRDEEWRRRYEADWRNLSAALAWACRRGEPALQARLVATLGELETFAQTATELLDFTLDAQVLASAAAPWSARALLALGWAHNQDGNREQGSALALQALAIHEQGGHAADCFQCLSRLIRMFHGRPGMQHRLAEMWQRIQRIDIESMPLRARLNWLSSAAYLVGERRSLQRLHELRRLALHAGFDNIAAVCLVNITDELMVQGRDEEVVAAAREMLAGWQRLPRRRALVSHNLALSLVRLGRVEEAREPARVLLRSSPGLAYMAMDLFALAATREGRHDEAALIAGRSAAIKRERDLLSEVAEAAIIDETLRRLHESLGPARVAELLGAGAQMTDAEVLQLALPD